MSFSSNGMMQPPFIDEQLRQQLSAIINPAKSSERKIRDLSFVKLDQLEGAMNKLFDAIGKEDSLKETPEIASMVRLRQQIDELEHNHTLADEDRKKQKAQLELEFSKSSGELFAKLHNTPDDPHVKPVAEFLAKPENHALVQNVEHSLKAALASSEKIPTFNMSKQEIDEMQQRWSTAEKLGVADKMSSAYKAATAAIDSKNGKWDEQGKGWDNWKSYDQMTPDEKHTTAEAVKKAGEAWQDVIDTARKDGGPVPPAIQKEYDLQAEYFKRMGFGDEFAKRELKENYPAATASKRDHDGATVALAQNLVQKVAEYDGLEQPQNGLSGGKKPGAPQKGSSV